MTLRILKALVPIDDAWHEIPGGRVVHVDHQTHNPDPQISVWFERDDQAEPTTRQVRVFGTGQPLPEERTRHLGTVLMLEGEFVAHLRELVTEPEPDAVRIVVNFTNVADPEAVQRDIEAAIRRYEQLGGRA